MDIFEIEQKERMSREEVAARLRTLADMLARHNDIEFERGGMHMKVHVPDEIQVKVLEIDKSGKIRLSRKEAMGETGQPAGGN